MANEQKKPEYMIVWKDRENFCEGIEYFTREESESTSSILGRLTKWVNAHATNRVGYEVRAFKVSELDLVPTNVVTQYVINN